MKTIILTCAISVMTLAAQKSIASGSVTGLYLTAEDYVHHKLSFSTNGSDKNHIRLNEFLQSAKVVVMYNGKKQTFLKSRLFGYSRDNQDYRYFNNIAYRIIDTRDFLIYSAPRLKQQAKWSKPENEYYFSSTDTAAIVPLSIKNLEAVYVSNTKFRYMIESGFATDNSLTAYDTALKEYKVKYLYEQSSSN